MTIESRAKVMAPQVSPFAVFRAGLVRQLDEAVRHKLTLLVAPPGYGKSMLLAQWAATNARRHAAWLTLDAADSNAVTFARSLIMSIQRAYPTVGTAAGERVATSGSSMGDEFIVSLLDDLAHLPETVIVIDDVESVRNPAVLDELSVVVEQAPPNIHVVLSGRSDPPLSLHRMRVRGDLAEIRQDSLRMNETDATDVIRRVSKCDLSAEQVRVLLRRTEGWPAGLLMAALSLRGHSNPGDFVQMFSGDDRNVADYLADEVLRRQPREVQEFLLDTSVLRRMSGELCDAVTGRNDSQRILERLERSGLFVIRLDDRRHWFRYHSLLRDLLRYELRAADRARQVERLRRAAAWHTEHNDLEIAGDYLVAAELWDELVDFVRLHGRTLVERGTIGVVIMWLAEAPEELRTGRPDVALLWAVAQSVTGRTLAADEILTELQRAHELSAWEEAVAHATRASMVQYHLPPDRALDAADRGLRLAAQVGPEADRVPVFGMQSWQSLELVLGLAKARASHYLGEVSEATAQLGVLADADQGESLAVSVHTAGALALAETDRGRLQQAHHLAVRAIQIAQQSGHESHLGTADAYLALAQVRRERNDLEEAAMSLDEAYQRVRRNGRHMLQWLHTTEAAMLALAQDQAESGLALITQRRFEGQPEPAPFMAARVAAAEARLLLADGRVGDALDLLDSFGGLRTGEVVAAHVATSVAARDIVTARKHLEAFPTESAGRTAIERLLWEAIVEDLDGDHRAGRDCMEAAVDAASREGFSRVFLDAGTHGWRLVRSLYHVAPTPFLRQLVDQPVAPAPPHARVTGIVEQLSDREILVLRYLPSRLSNPEIARNLYVSVNTLKTHLKHIYRKLGVANRSEAIEVAESLGLL